MARRPLTERSAQGRAQQNRKKMSGLHKRTYGKGGTASSRAILSDPFLDENEIEEQRLRMSPGAAVSPLSNEDDAKLVPPESAAPVARKGKEVQTVPAVDSKAVAYTSPLLAECLTPKGLCDFSAWAERVAGAFKVVKVAEGSYGEVFKLEKIDNPSSTTSTMPQQDPNIHGGCIFKLIPLRAKSSTSKAQTALDSLVREVQMLKLMDAIPGFARFRDLTVLQGPYPASFAEAHNDYKAKKAKEAQNPKPSTYSRKQLWAMVEMDDGGKDLEILRKPSAYQIFDIFWLTCCSLAYAEDHAEFEHRDLHIGNICIKATQANGILDISRRLNASMQPPDLLPSHFGYSGLRTTIIDYTLSRATLLTQPTPTIIFDPLKILSLFNQKGKTPEQTSQCTTYRSMRTHALAIHAQSLAADPSPANQTRDKWSRFLPRTNALWLHCLLFTLLHRSKEEVVPLSSEVAARLQRGIYARMQGLMDVLEGDAPPGGARELLRLALKEDFLGTEDLEAIKRVLE